MKKQKVVSSYYFRCAMPAWCFVQLHRRVHFSSCWDRLIISLSGENKLCYLKITALKKIIASMGVLSFHTGVLGVWIQILSAGLFPVHSWLALTSLSPDALAQKAAVWILQKQLLFSQQETNKSWLRTERRWSKGHELRAFPPAEFLMMDSVRVLIQYLYVPTSHSSEERQSWILQQH